MRQKIANVNGTYQASWSLAQGAPERESTLFKKPYNRLLNPAETSAFRYSPMCRPVLRGLRPSGKPPVCAARPITSYTHGMRRRTPRRHARDHTSRPREIPPSLLAPACLKQGAACSALNDWVISAAGSIINREVALLFGVARATSQ